MLDTFNSRLILSFEGIERSDRPDPGIFWRPADGPNNQHTTAASDNPRYRKATTTALPPGTSAGDA